MVGGHTNISLKYTEFELGSDFELNVLDISKKINQLI